MKLIFASLISLGCLSVPANAQGSAEVQFETGNFGAMVTGAVTGNGYFDHVLGARAGQQMFAELSVAQTDGSGVAYFNILPPGSDGVAIYNGSIDGNSAVVDLPQDGDYTVRVYLMGNDRDTGKTVNYNLDLSIQ